MIRSVLIVDDHPGFRSWARSFLEAEGYLVVGEAVDGAEAMEAVGRLRPDLVLLDVHLPDVDGFEVASQLARAREPPAVVLISSREPGEFGTRPAEAEVRGFISKMELTGETLAAVVSEGG